MKELIEACDAHPGAAVWLGMFAVAALSILCAFVLNMTRALKGLVVPPTQCRFHEPEEE